MATTLTPPRAGVAIGWAQINGQRTRVELDPEYLRFFFTLYQRAGGTSAPSSGDLSASLADLEALAAAEQQAPADGRSAAISEMVKQLSGFEQAPSDGGLRAEVDQLRNRIEGLEQK